MTENIVYAYAPITKVDKANRRISGPISGPNNVDLDGQIVDVDFLRRAAPAWMKFGNIREQHNPARAIGKAIELQLDTADGVPEITAYIADRDAWEKIEAGVYSGFSVGIKNARIVRDPVARNGRIVDGDLVEVSAVDHPCNTNAKFAICKSVGGSGWYDMQNNALLEPEGQNLKMLQESEVYKRYYSQEERDDMDKDDFAGPHESFPIKTQEDVHNAASLIGHADDPAAVKAKIKEIARRKGFSLPKEWEDDDNEKKNVNPDETKAPERDDDDADEREEKEGGDGEEKADAEKAGAPDFNPTMDYEHYHGAAKHTHAHKGEEHTHCRQCGSDDRVCGHIKSRMGKSSTPDKTKAESGFMDGEASPETAHPTPASLTMRRSISTLLSDVQSRLDALAREVGERDSDGDIDFPHNGAEGKTDPAFGAAISTPERPFGDGTMFDAKLKAAVTDILKDILPDLVQREIAKSFGNSDLVTKGATPDTIKQVVSELAKEAADAAIEPVVTRLTAVEEFVPVQGIANTKDVSKTFAANPATQPTTIDDLAKMVQTLPEDQRHMAAMEMIKAAQTQPIKLFG